MQDLMGDALNDKQLNAIIKRNLLQNYQNDFKNKSVESQLELILYPPGHSKELGKEQVSGNDQDESSLDVWDTSVITGTVDRIWMHINKRKARTRMNNDKMWYNLFGTLSIDRDVKYHWKIRINEYNRNWVMYIGIMDIVGIDNGLKNKSFAESQGGYGMDATGKLKHAGKVVAKSKHFEDFKNGDIVDIYFDRKQWTLWYGLNGQELNASCKVHGSVYKFCVGMFATYHGIELLSCQTYS